MRRYLSAVIRFHDMGDGRDDGFAASMSRRYQLPLASRPRASIKACRRYMRDVASYCRHYLL